MPHPVNSLLTFATEGSGSSSPPLATQQALDAGKDVAPWEQRGEGHPLLEGEDYDGDHEAHDGGDEAQAKPLC